MKRTGRLWSAALSALALLATACSANDEAVQPGGTTTVAPPVVTTVAPSSAPATAQRPPELGRLEGITTTASVGGGAGIDRWQEEVPGIQDVRIRSTADGQEQQALWLPPAGEGPQPVLVVVHSWSHGYLQHAGIPFGRWAAQHGWGMVHPDFRGRFAAPEATGSDLAVQDVIDAVDFALQQGAVAPDKVFLIGFSGGGMMSLLTAGRHPGRFAGAVAWVPIHDLVDWHEYNAQRQTRYADEIQHSCGGDPRHDPQARSSCEHRSPRAHLDAARQAGLPVYIGHGVDDSVVPPSHSLQAFNQLAEQSDRLPEQVVAAAGRVAVADELRGRIEAETYFDDGDPPVVFSRRSGPVTLVLFEGGHEMAYHPGLQWMVKGSGAWPR
ncbi:MAG: prolyl oligopeptidase family serine peptidase [Actinomycetota bacterium]|nr:prolyl oligopeptidase family serine peptidase [Actinomycetota bacterium]